MEILSAKKHIPILFIIILSGMITVILYRKYKIQDCSRVFIAHPVNISGNLKTGYSLYYTFNNNLVDYEGHDMISKGDYRNNGENYYLDKKFFVNVSCTDKNNSEIVLDIPVPDTLKFVPANGWDKIPYGLSKK